MSGPDLIASPASSGGEGTYFEQHVDAYWLALLLVDAIPPIVLGGTIAKVSFQTEHLGWSTDDVLVTSRTSAGEVRQLACQVKKTLTVGADNDEFAAAIVDAWKDFSSGKVFRENVDAIAIVTQFGTNVVLRDFGGLLECARASATSADFEHRLATPGFVNAQVCTHAGVIEKIVSTHEEGIVARERIWRFLRHLYVLSLDLNTGTSQTAAHVRTLLAHTATATDRLAAAAATWNELVAEVSRGAPRAWEYERTSLPESVLARHAPLSTADRRALDRLANHSRVIVDGIRTTIGDDLHLPRTQVVTHLLDALECSRVLLVAGAAGSGKSAIVKEAAALLEHDHFVFAFRAEELAQPHFDTTLTTIGISLSAEELSGVLAGQPRKILIVESVERLLEASSRDAFIDLLRFVRNDPTWRLILTCRDYSIELLRTAFLDAAATVHDTLQVPPLTDDELEEAARHAPIVRRLLASDPLRALLRNPYILNMAVRMPWREDDRLPESEREFRGRFWRSSVRAEDRREGGLPQRRADAFMQLCARRAQALTLFAPTAGLDAEAVKALENDSLVVTSPENWALAAPAHDVLEDWGVLEWIEHLYQQTNQVEEFASRLGGYPAVRRTYRTWISELLERDPASADAFFDNVLKAEVLPQHFSDDTIIAFLRSDHAAALLTRHAARLVEDDKRLLRRIVHLLRIGCVAVPAWIPSRTASSILFCPEGDAWPTVLSVVRDHLSLFDGRDRQLLLGLVEDFAKGVNWQAPYPAGHDAAAAITLWLIAQCGGYQSEDLLKRALKVLVKIPASDPTTFAIVLRGQASDERDRTAEELQEIVFNSMDGFAVARDLPDLIVQVGKAYLLATSEDLDDRYGYAVDIELFFGIKESRGHGHLPPSAWRGPFRPLLQHHWKKGRDFIVDLLNYSADWYGKRLGPDRNIEPAFEITLTFADGATKKQWANARLWQLYRGTSVTPYPLQSAAMALEAFLFEVAKQDVNLLDPVLLQLLRVTTSAAVTAVVASIAVAYPHACGETLLVLLSCPECILLDRARMASDRTGASVYSRLPQDDLMNEMFAKERAEADAQPHRQQDLETAITLLQAGPHGARVHAVIDKYRAAVPPSVEQNEEDRVWRLALHRMDLRNYRPTPAEELSGVSVPANYVVLTPTTPETDLQEMVEESSNRHARVSERIGNQMWGIKVFERDSGSYDPAEWRTRLAAVRASKTTVLPDEMFFGDGAAVTAAVCVRDHWSEMTDDERDWCKRRVCDEIVSSADDWSEAPQMLGLMNGAVPAASVVPQIVMHVDAAGRTAALTALAAALTHPNREVHVAAARASRDLWSEQRDLALRCVHALRVQAMTFQQSFDAEQAKPYQQRAVTEKLRSRAASIARKIILGRRATSADDVAAFTLDGWFTADASIAILIMLSNAPTERTTVDGFAQVATTLVAWWEADRHDRSHRRESRSYETEYALKELLAEGLFRVAETDAAMIVQPLLDAVDTHADKVADILHDIVIREDHNHLTPRFWFLWKLFADRVRTARWLPSIDAEHASGRQLLDRLLLARGWKDSTRHWTSLEGYAHNVHAFFEQLPLSRAVLRCYLLFLYHIGEQSLPEAFIRLHAKMRDGNAPELLSEGDSAYVLESLLLRYVYAKPLELKRRSDMRAAILFLLDALVETGSSAAFRMRDDFVTPLSATSQQGSPREAATG